MLSEKKKKKLKELRARGESRVAQECPTQMTTLKLEVGFEKKPSGKEQEMGG